MSENSWEDLKEKGNALFKQKRYEDAIVFYNKALKLNPNVEVLYSNKGTCEKCLKQYKESIRDYEKSLEINPKNTKNMNRLASVYIIRGQIGNAKMLQEKALNLEPNNSIFREQMTTIEKILEDDAKLEDKIKELKKVKLKNINLNNYQTKNK
jgi:tetratricopeptide (TPR) repeat protein